MFYSQNMNHLKITPYMSFKSDLNRKVKIRRQVVHDIKSPLSALNILSENIEGSKKDLLKKIIIRIESITNSLNNFGDLLEPSPIALLIKDLIYEKKLEYQQASNISLSLDIKSNYIFSIIDSDLFKRCLSNIINNSYEALSGNGHINITLTKKHNKVLILITDNGRGISKKNLQKVCDYGVSIDKLNGTGLGLTHAKECIESWGGTLHIDSIVKKGTVVSIKLPLVQTSSLPSND